jgi:uncharacterized protein YuzE
MKISYDAEVDALYIRLIEGRHECRTLRLNDDIALNIGEGETLVGIEVLDARQVLGAGSIPTVAIENLALAAVRKETGESSVIREEPPEKGRKK